MKRAPGKISLALWFGAAIAAATSSIGCSGGTDGSSSGAPSATSGPADACVLLGSADVVTILGGKVGEAQPILQMGDAEQWVSQCRVDLEGTDKYASLMLRYAAREQNPASREAFIGSDTSANVMGMGEETAAAIRAGQVVPELGQLAFTYEMFGLNLMVFWEEHYQMTVMLNGFTDEARTLEQATKIARNVLAEL